MNGPFYLSALDYMSGLADETPHMVCGEVQPPLNPKGKSKRRFRSEDQHRRKGSVMRWLKNRAMNLLRKMVEAGRIIRHFMQELKDLMKKLHIKVREEIKAKLVEVFPEAAV